jgi:hypothetical protein
MSFGSLRSRPVNPLISGSGGLFADSQETIVLLVPFVPLTSGGITLGEDIARAGLFEGHHLCILRSSSGKEQKLLTIVLGVVFLTLLRKRKKIDIKN